MAYYMKNALAKIAVGSRCTLRQFLTSMLWRGFGEIPGLKDTKSIIINSYIGCSPPKKVVWFKCYKKTGTTMTFK
jgi:hypothetical protein